MNCTKYKIFYRRPGILCLVNDTDWELEGKEDAVLSNKDEIGFISTLHGGWFNIICTIICIYN